MIDRVSGYLHRLFEERKFVRRTGIIGLYVLITYASIVIFSPHNLPHITTAMAIAYGELCALLGVCYKFYNDSRCMDKHK